MLQELVSGLCGERAGHIIHRQRSMFDFLPRPPALISHHADHLVSMGGWLLACAGD
jgi:hypothetical protein